MNLRFVVTTLTSSLVFATAASAAPTQPRAWVSGAGTDTVSCGTVDAPCRTFQYVHNNVVAAGGSVYVKDPANYGQIVISKSISLINDGSGTSTIFATSGDAIDVNTDGDVLIKGLTLDGAGLGANGVSFVSPGGSLTMENCVVRGFTSRGVSIVPSFGGSVVIVESLITGNAGAGIFTFGDGSGSLTLTLGRDRIVNNGFESGGYGVRLTGDGAAYQFTNIESTLIAHNGIGLSVEASSSNIVSGAVFDSKLLGNSTSIKTTAGALVRLERTSVQAAFPAGGVITNNGSIVSFGDNAIVDSVTGNAISTTSLR